MEINNSAKDKENKKKYKMALLFIQTRELHNLYKSDNLNSPHNYYLVKREWLENYKNINNYNYSINMLNSFNDWKDYSDFKQIISKYVSFDKKDFTVFGVEDALENIFNFSLKKQKIQNYLGFPTDCELVKEEFFQDCSNGKIGFPYYKVWIGNNLIIIIDSETQNVAFLCSLVESQGNDYNSLIKVDCVLAYECENYMNIDIENIISLKSKDKYFSDRNININLDIQQNIINKEGKKLGILFVIKDGQYINDNNQINKSMPDQIEFNNNNLHNKNNQNSNNNQNINNNIINNPNMINNINNNNYSYNIINNNQNINNNNDNYANDQNINNNNKNNINYNQNMNNKNNINYNQNNNQNMNNNYNFNNNKNNNNFNNINMNYNLNMNDIINNNANNINTNQLKKDNNKNNQFENENNQNQSNLSILRAKKKDNNIDINKNNFYNNNINNFNNFNNNNMGNNMNNNM